MEFAAKGKPADYLVGVRSLRKYKKTAEYRTQLLTEGRKARLDAVEARTDMGKRRARLRDFECQAELASLQQGDEPSAFTGLIRFPTTED